MRLGVPQRTLWVLCGHFQHQRRVFFEECAADQLQNMTSFLLGSTWSVLLLRFVMRNAMSEVQNVYPQLKVKVHVGDIKIHVWEKEQEVLQTVPKVVSTFTSVFEVAKPNPSLIEGGERREVQAYCIQQVSRIRNLRCMWR